ncbi:MAG: carboxypeptidase regulatory-like domain-containing protein [Lysobacterales bacterium]
MNKKSMGHRLRRNAIVIALGLALAGQAYAQSSVGSIFGEASSNAAVTIENLDTGVKREITADSQGRYTFGQLPPGHYRVSSGGSTRDANVVVGTGTRIDLTAATLDAVTVTAQNVNPIDISSVESTTVFSQERIQSLPIPRDITNVALLAPGTVKGDTGFGNLASFGGASVAENGYYINGFDVTNIRNFISYATLPFDAIAEQQIKTGGYGAEFGRSLGGVINIVTKRGTNEWKGGASVYWSPAALRERGRDVSNRNADAFADGITKYVYRSDNEFDRLSYNVYGGGALVEDRLFFFGLIEGQNNTDDTYTRLDSTATKDTDPTGMVKLDWNISDNHLLELTGIRNKTETGYKFYQRDEPRYAQDHENLVDSYKLENGGWVGIAKYTGYLTDDFTLSAQYGKLKNTDNYRTVAPEGADCPAVYDSRPAGNPLNFIGCWNESAFTVTDREFGPDTDERRAWRIDAEWRLGDHLVRFGYDDETFTSGHAGTTYSGGIYYRYFTSRSGRVNGVTVPVGTEYVRVRDFQSSSSSYDVINTAGYIEDSWQINENLLLYGGLRVETFENRNAEGTSFVEADNLLAPRLGFSWDMRGDSTVKIFGNAGRYHIPVAANTNIRASGSEVLIEQFFNFTGINPTTGAPNTLGSQLGNTNVNGSLEPPNPATVASTNLDPMYQDEFILGAQWAINDTWTAGVRGISREVKNGVDDFCSLDAIVDYVNANGYPDFDGSTLATCMILNPGRSLDIGIDVEGDGNLVDFSIPANVIGLPDYKRQYYAIELFWEANFSNEWFLQGSYTWAHSYGNIEGYVNSTLEQDDAGLTQDFDHPRFEDGAYGNLPNDRRHTFKLFGSYNINEEWRVGGNLLVQSGRPVSCNGFVPLDGLNPDGDGGSLALYGASSFYCRPADGEPSELTYRGQYGRTPWIYSVDGSLSYMPNWAEGLTLQVDIFNLFNSSKVTEYSETGDLSRADESVNPNFLNDVNYQTPRSIRLTARYSF